MSAKDSGARSQAAVLLDLPIEEIAERLPAVDAQTLELVRFTASNKALSASEISTDARLHWAGVAIQAIQQMRTEETDMDLDLDQKEMRVRAGLIGKVGAERSHVLLDPEDVADWFFASLGDETLENATADAALSLTGLNTERLRALRRIKNDLNVVRLMAAAVSTVAPPRDVWLAEWLRLRPSLP